MTNLGPYILNGAIAHIFAHISPNHALMGDDLETVRLLGELKSLPPMTRDEQDALRLMRQRYSNPVIGVALEDGKKDDVIKVMLTPTPSPLNHYTQVAGRVTRIPHPVLVGDLTRPETRVPPVELSHVEAHVLTGNKDHGAAAKILSMSIPKTPVFLCSCNICLSDALKTVLIKKALRTDAEIELCDICESRKANYTVEV